VATSSTESFRAVLYLGLLLAVYGLLGFVDRARLPTRTLRESFRKGGQMRSDERMARQRMYISRIARWPILVCALVMVVSGLIGGFLLT
jgi:hypothetical protein